MKKKDYEMVASNFYRQIEICKERGYDISQIEMLAYELCNDFEKENPKFQRVKFMEACGVE